MKKDLISVIIPSYNNEKYLSKCLDSILNQTYSNLEIIIVDDCSTDNSFSVLEKYSKKNKQIRVYKNNTNSGAGYCRNFGLRSAKGNYISFIDSDDYIEENFYEKLYSKIKEEDSDLAICDIYIRYSDSSKDIRSKAVDGKCNKINIINNGLAASPCNKLFKKSFLEKYPFCEGIMNEDIATVIPIIIDCKKISYSEDTFYNYIQHSDSVQNSYFSEKKFDIFKAVNELVERIQNKKSFSKYLDIIVYNQIFLFFIYVMPREKNIIKRAKYIKKFKNLSKKYYIKKNKYVWNFWEVCGKKHAIYYRILLKLMDYNFFYVTSLLIYIYDVIKKLMSHSVIKQNITYELLEKAAKKQSLLKNNKVNISVVVPNYNYADFLLERIYSILNQKVKLFELIILDDCSKDDSKEVIENIYNRISNYINVKKLYNNTNSGSAFKQWKKGFEVATGNYIWIAEADDYCDDKLLKKLLKPILKNDNIMISYADTAFIDKKGNILLRTIKKEIDIQKSGHWDKSYVNNGMNEIKNFSYLNCTIANVSSCIIKNGNYTKYFNMSGKYKQAGDWLFYVNLMSQGDISFNKKVLNYYRVHGNNVSSTTKYKLHIEEIKSIHKYFYKSFKLNKKHLKKMNERIAFLKKVWKVED